MTMTTATKKVGGKLRRDGDVGIDTGLTGVSIYKLYSEQLQLVNNFLNVNSSLRRKSARHNGTGL